MYGAWIPLRQRLDLATSPRESFLMTLLARPLLVATALLAAMPAGAADRAYVICDNGLRCIAAPCPSTNALDLGRRAVERGVWVDVGGLSRAERDAIQSDNALYEGTRVISARREDRAMTVMERNRVLPFLVATKVLRASTPAERRLCNKR